MVGLFWSINIIIATINSFILVWVFILYARSHHRLGSKFSKALLLFAILLLLQSIIATIVYIRLKDYYGPDVAIPLIPINVLSLLAMLTLLWISRQ